MSNYTSENLVPVSSAAALTPAIKIGDIVIIAGGTMIISSGAVVSGTTSSGGIQ